MYVSGPGANNFYPEPQGFKFLAGLASLASTVVAQTTGLKPMYSIARRVCDLFVLI